MDHWEAQKIQTDAYGADKMPRKADPKLMNTNNTPG